MKLLSILSTVIAITLIHPILLGQESASEIGSPAKPDSSAPNPVSGKKNPPDKSRREHALKNRPRSEQNRSDSQERPQSHEKRAWLGIATIPIHPALAQHLLIPDGFGIQVIEVSPDSPAEKAGLSGNDILLKLDDQRLISPEHLSRLIREKSKGDSVSLTVIQNGTTELLTAVLDEIDEPSSPNEILSAPGGSMNPTAPQWLEALRRNWPTPQVPMQPNGVKPYDHANPTPNPQSRTPRGSVRPGLPLHIYGDEGVLRIKNDEGELTLTRHHEQYRLELRDSKGTSIYDGPYDPDEGEAALPDEAQRLLDSMKINRFDFRIPNANSTPSDSITKARNKKPSPELESLQMKTP